MKLFSKLYSRVMAWARNKRAPYYLAALSVAESSFFPIPPDVMLAPMSLAKPNKAMRYALITTIASVIGGLIGYFIGFIGQQTFIVPILESLGYLAKYNEVVAWFNHWGILVVFVAGFSPIPYKLFTLASGALSMPLLPFILASLIGRGARFYIVATLMKIGGKRFEDKLMVTIDRLGWLTVSICVASFCLYSITNY